MNQISRFNLQKIIYIYIIINIVDLNFFNKRGFMAVFLQQSYNSLGFHFSDATIPTNGQSTTDEKGRATLYNILTVTGYVPVIGTIIGIARIVLGSTTKNMQPSDKIRQYSNAQICRGAIETLSLGFLFIIPDLIATIARACSNSSKKERNEIIV
jgi:hypothetical protein